MEPKEQGFKAADLFLNHVKSIPAYVGFRDLNMEIVNKIGLELGLLFISDDEISGETCFANSEELRPEFKLSFTARDLLFYLKGMLGADKRGIPNDIMHQIVPYPGDVGKFWKLVSRGKQSHISIVNYKPEYQQAFRNLNVQWITSYFKMEEADYKALDNPQEYILDKGGLILVALYDDEPVGVCALIKMNDGIYDFELAKMAVSPTMQGKRIGWLLGNGIVEKAASLGAGKIYLESNTILEPAINLYHKLGFQKISGRATPYERCNIQMERLIK